MMTINEIIHSELFLYAKSRKILLPLITHQVKALFEAKEEVSDEIGFTKLSVHPLPSILC